MKFELWALGRTDKEHKIIAIDGCERAAREMLATRYNKKAHPRGLVLYATVCGGSASLARFDKNGLDVINPGPISAESVCAGAHVHRYHPMPEHYWRK